MKLSFLIKTLISGASLMLLVSPAQAGEYGYWDNGYWYRCDYTNQYCRTQPDPDYYPDYYHEPYSPEPSYYPYNNKSLFGIDVNLCISILGINTCN